MPAAAPCPQSSLPPPVITSMTRSGELQKSGLRSARVPTSSRPTSDAEPPPIEPPPWTDVTTIVLTDDEERRALIVPIEPSSRTPLALSGPEVRLRLELDRERYRSAAPDPAARAQAA